MCILSKKLHLAQKTTKQSFSKKKENSDNKIKISNIKSLCEVIISQYPSWVLCIFEAHMFLLSINLTLGIKLMCTATVNN